MPIKTSSGKWRWGNVERSSKKELVQTVYGIWKKNGSKGSFSDFLKGTHESLDESFNLNKTNLYFHGSFDKDIKKIDKPSTEHPFCVTQDIQYALDYADGGDESDDSTNGVVYLVTIDKDSLKIFDFEDDSDIKKLNSKWPSKILDCFSKKHKANKGKLIDPLIVCDLLINDMDYSEDDSEITTLMNTSVLKRLEKFVGKKWKNTFEFRDDPSIKSGEYILRNLLLTDIKDLGFNGYKAHEQSGHSSDRCFILFDLDCMDRIFLQPIPFKDAVAAAEYIDKKFKKSNIDIDYKKHDAAIKEFIRSLKKTKQSVKESYEPPYTLDAIKQKYGDEVYRKLRDDPVHRFRAETGIEVIHKEPTRDEFERIVKNWDLMTPEQKKQSDEFSIKIFGNDNKRRVDLLRQEYDFEVGDKVKVRHGIRCKQAGHIGEIVNIEPPNKYGWSSFIVKFDEPEIGTMGFFSNDLEKIDSIKEDKWSKNERYFYCDDCNKNMTKAPDDQYIMIDNDLWEYVCKHGGKKLVPDEDVLCRDCIEKRLGRRLTLKDLGDKINLPVNDEIKKILKKKKNMKESIVSEGKHWPEDYVKTAFNAIKNSDLGKQNWYTDNYINQDLKSIVDEFGPLSHKNSNLGYFATIIKWFIAYAGKDKNKYQEFIERKLDGIIKTLLWLSNNPGEESKLKEQIKTKWTFDDFEKYQKEVEDQISREQSDKLKNVKLQDKGYEIIPIDSYQELHEKFGGDKTGYKGDSRWCHTNGSSTYNSWTSGGKYNFFVLAKKGWEKIEPPNPADKTTKAYDEYGTSLIAILVDVASGKLLNATLRWNHVIEPSLEREGTSVDKAFLGWGDLAEVTGKDVEKEIKEQIKDKQEALKKEAEEANRQINEYLESHKDKIKELNPETNFKIINKFKDIVTKIEIPDGVTSIGSNAFYECSELTSVTIPASVTSIGSLAFRNCSSLTSVTIPAGVASIGNYAFSNCSGMTSVTIPDGVTSIGDSAFSGCSGLTSVTIPDSVTSIGNDAFRKCSRLTSIVIPDSVTNIRSNAFYGCSNLKIIYCSENTWKKYKDKFPEEAERKDPKEMKKESVNEAHQIHSYPSSLDSVIEKITGGEDVGYELDHAYFNKQYKFIWMRNSKGYFHIFKPVKFVKTPGMTKPFGFKDLILKDNGMLEEVDRLRFTDGNEGLNYLKNKYNLKIKTIS